jgi:DMSO/TMAO reductase YedYZ molybdopterin-dependent catalytic subunit
MVKRERLVGELYADDPERADALVFGRRTGLTRRGFLEGAGLAAMGAAVGGPIVFALHMPGGLVPAAFAQQPGKGAAGDKAGAAPEGGGPHRLRIPGKDPGLVVLRDSPLVAETPEHLLDDDTTPTARFYVSNSGLPPEPERAADPDAWRLVIDGEVNRPMEIALGDLKKRGAPRTWRMVLESAGNGRSFLVPRVDGPQWTNGGAGCAQWTGVPLASVLRAAGVRPSAVYTGHYGADRHVSGDATRPALSRGVPMAKAMSQYSLLVWAMNGQPLPHLHGGPLRLIHPGWPGSASHKWLTRITLRDREHDGEGMQGFSNRVPSRPMMPGSTADAADFRILQSMPVRGIVTSPANGTRLPAGTRELRLRGAAWAGELEVLRVDLSLDFGATWQRAALAAARNRFDWRRWIAAMRLPSDGYYEVWVRATDSAGRAQPHTAGNWNPGGYGANPMHRIAVLVG